MENLKKAMKNVNVPRLIILAFFLLIVALMGAYKLDVLSYLGSVIKYAGMWGILALAMIPSIQCGVGPNFGVSLGIVCGILSGLLTIEFDIAGIADKYLPGSGQWAAIFFAMIVGAIIAWVVGVLYGMLLNRVKGDEMTVTTYVGYSIIYLMSVVWFTAPFTSGIITWAIGGKGVRNQINLNTSFGSVLNNAGGFTLFAKEGVTAGVYIPTGLIVFVLLMCLFVFIYMRTKTGKAITAVGSNPQFARASGINVNKMRIRGMALSTMLGAIGIIVYAQGYGFIQAYSAPLSMGFQCVAAVLIGGATTKSAKISHVIIGTFLFQGLIIMTPPLSNVMLQGTDISDTMRQIIQNGVILYALTKAKGGVSSEE